jgi:hypothetical protein
VTLCALYLLASIVTPVFSAHSGTLYRLAIDYAGAGLRISLQADAQAFSEGSVDALRGAVHAPLPEVMVDGRPSGEVVREQAPLAAAPQEVEDGV